jgi:hypothetical protein
LLFVSSGTPPLDTHGSKRHAAARHARIEVAAEQDLLVILVAVLDVLDAEERERAADRQGDAGDQQLLLIELRRADGPRRREAREDEDGGVDRAVLHVQVLVRVRVQLGVVVAIEDIGDEQRREEQHLLRQEQPDAELAGVELVLGVVVVVLDEPRVVAVAALGVRLVAVVRALGVAVVVPVGLVGFLGHLSSSPGGTVGGTGPAPDERPLVGFDSTPATAWACSPLA